jgi:prepilin-type processing-associated H-X9-DG protein
MQMNDYVGGWDGGDTQVVAYHKLTSIPPKLFLFTDVMTGTGNRGMFLFDPQNNWMVYPSFNHNRGASFTFIDGHSEVHHWRDTDSDIGWMTERTK